MTLSGYQTPDAYSVTSPIPNGMSLNSMTGTISGVLSAPGMSSISIPTVKHICAICTKSEELSPWNGALNFFEFSDLCEECRKKVKKVKKKIYDELRIESFQKLSDEELQKLLYNKNEDFRHTAAMVWEMKRSVE